MTKEILLRFPEEIFNIIKKFKDISNVSYTNFIYNAVVWYCISKGLLSLEYVKLNGTKPKTKKEEIQANVLPEALKFCDGDKCEL